MAFGHSYRYVPGANGEQFCFDVHPTYRCPFAGHYEPGDDGIHRQVLPRLPEDLAAAAAAAGITDLAKLLADAHRMHDRARDDKNKLTDRCNKCGAKMRKLGFRFWKQVPADPDSSRATMGSRLGFNSHETVGGTLYADTKKEARQWAADEAQASRAAANPDPSPAPRTTP